MASLLHDIGGFYYRTRIDTLNFEISPKNNHAEIGALLLEKTNLFKEIGQIIRYHHTDYEKRDNYNVDEKNFYLDQIVYISDRFSVQFDKNKRDTKEAIKVLSSFSNTKFKNIILEALKSASQKDIFSSDLKTTYFRIFEDELNDEFNTVFIDDLQDMANIFSRIIDYKSRFTYSHSSLYITNSKTTCRYDLFF